MTLTHTPLNTRDGGRQVDTRAMPRPHRIAPAIPTAPATERYSLLWFGWVALACVAAAAVLGPVFGWLVSRLS